MMRLFSSSLVLFERNFQQLLVNSFSHPQRLPASRRTAWERSPTARTFFYYNGWICPQESTLSQWVSRSLLGVLRVWFTFSVSDFYGPEMERGSEMYKCVSLCESKKITFLSHRGSREPCSVNNLTQTRSKVFKVRVLARGARGMCTSEAHTHPG